MGKFWIVLAALTLCLATQLTLAEHERTLSSEEAQKYLESRINQLRKRVLTRILDDEVMLPEEYAEEDSSEEDDDRNEDKRFYRMDFKKSMHKRPSSYIFKRPISGGNRNLDKDHLARLLKNRQELRHRMGY